MTVAAKVPSKSYVEDGVSLDFPAPFRYLDATSLEVTRFLIDGTSQDLALGPDFTATPGPTDAGGTVTLTLTVAGARLKITRATPRVQPVDYQTNDRFPAETHELALDRDMLIEQEQDAGFTDLNDRALTVPPGETIEDLPPADERAQGVLGFDADGNPVILPSEALGSVAVTAQRREVIASAGQTTFQTNAQYTVGYVGVFVNGVRLSEQEFVATDGSNVVLDEPCLAGDVVLLEAFLGSNVVNPLYALTNLANVPVSTIAHLRGVFSDEALAPGVPFTPNGNPVASMGGIVFQYQSAQANMREISASFGMYAVTGDANTNPASGYGDKIALYAGAYAAAHAFNLWALNTSTTIAAAATTVHGAWGYEMDLINQCQHSGNVLGPTGLVAPVYVGFDAVLNGAFNAMAAYKTTVLAAGKWNRGFVAIGIANEAFADYSNAATSFSIFGSHDKILDWSNAVIASYAIFSESLKVRPSGDNFVQVIQNSSNSSLGHGLQVNTTWATGTALALEVKTAGNQNFVVSGLTTNPVSLRVNGVMRNAQVYNDGTRNLLMLV